MQHSTASGSWGISPYSGDPEKALELVEEAHRLALFHALPPSTIPDVLFWKGRIFHALGRIDEALEAAEAALAGWEKSGDNYVGFCLTLLGQIHTVQGRHAEAKAHLDHAVLLLQRAKRELHRIAAVKALGDLMVAQDRTDEAHAYYTECLSYYNSINFNPSIIRIQSKVSSI